MKKHAKYSLLFVCLVMLMLNTACSSNSSTGIAMDEPVRRLIEKLTFHDGYIFIAEDVRIYNETASKMYNREFYDHRAVIKRINADTGAISSPCPDPLCTHLDINCPFFCGSSPSISCFDEWIVISSTLPDKQVMGGKISRTILYNTQTSEWCEIFPKDATVKNSSSFFGRIGKYLYHIAYGKDYTRDGQSYVPTNILRRNLKTGEEEVIYSHEYLITLSFISGERLYFYEKAEETCRTYSIDKNGQDLREEPNMTVIPNYIYQNRVYGDITSGAAENPLIIQDLTTGEIITIAEDYIRGSICVTEDKLYYMTKEYYTQSFVDASAVIQEAAEAKVGNPTKTEPYASRLKEIYRKRAGGTAYLWRCDLDGQNKELVVELPGAGRLFFQIYDGGLYTGYEFCDPETGELLGTAEEIGKPCRVDLATGEITILYKQEMQYYGKPEN